MRLNLATKLTLLMGGAMAFVVMTMALIVGFYVQNSLERANHERCLSSAGYLARYIRAPLIQNNLFLLHQYLHDTLDQGLFHSAVLLDNKGKVLMHSNISEVGKIYTDELSRQAMTADEPVFSDIFLTEKGMHEDEIFVPIIVAGVRLGTLRLGHSHKDIEKTIAEARGSILLLGLAATFFSLILANFLAAMISKPIRQLTDATKKVASGDLEHLVKVNRTDELGDLAQSFNIMTRGLNNTTVSYDYLLNIFNSAGDAIRTINLDYEIEMNNRSMIELLQLDHKKLDGFFCRELISADICKTDECVLKQILNGEKRVQIETEIKLYDNRKKYVSITATPLIENEKIVGVIESFQDITDTRTALEKNLSLENQLVQAQKMETVGRLSGGIAHDFNNLLSVILGYSELGLLTVPEDHPLRDKLQQIEDAARKAEALVRQLLAFSRKQVLEKTVLSPNDVINNMMKMIHRILGEDIELTVSLSEGTRQVYADQSQLVQVFMNLVVNARDAMPGGGKLIVETEDADLDESYMYMHDYVQPGPYVLLSITDTGIGMSKKVMKNIFEPFFTTKGPETGTGLGLSTVYGTIKQHGGYIQVYSEPDIGTTFKIYLPATDRENIEVTSTADWQARHGDETILIVDDEEVIRQLIVNSLQPLGYTILEAENGDEALALFESTQNKIDVLLTDVVMPGMGGGELADKITELSPETKIIFMSGYTPSIILKKKLIRADTFFIKKPVTPSLLSEKLRLVLDQQTEADST